MLSLYRLSSESFEIALEGALAESTLAQARLAASLLGDIPVEAISALSGGLSSQRLVQSLAQTREVAGLHDLALLGPAGEVLGASAGIWVTAEADADLIAAAAAGTARVGPLYRARDGALYQVAYAPLSGHRGWSVAVEGSGATLEAVNVLERRLLAVGGGTLLLAAALGAALASAMSRPLRRLSGALAAASPETRPEAIPVQGPREVREVGVAARALIADIQERDEQIQQGHARELRQLRALSAAVAHELRNPLNALSFSLSRLGADRPPERAARARLESEELIEELDSIIERFDDLGKPLAIITEPISLYALCSPLEAQAQALEVTLVMQPGGPSLTTDPRLLLQVLRNLMINAAQAGAGILHLHHAASGGRCIIELEDDGPGIPESIEAEVFDWFRTTRAGGSGLGLPSARRAARALGGDLILVCPRPARFRLTLPLGADP